MIAPLPDSAAASRAESGALIGGTDLARLRREVVTLIDVGPAVESGLARATRAALSRSGSLWRAQLAWSVGRAAGLAEEPALALAAGIEAFQTASLLFDDLPSMDDGESRRGGPCLHREHGEATAMLVALAFVHRGYARLWSAFQAGTPATRRRAGELVEANLGLDGILSGQARDLRYAAPANDEAEIRRIAVGKTVTLLRLALVLPALLAGRDTPTLGRLGELAEAWGLAYQFLDDLGEAAGDGGRAGTDARLGRPNLALAIGRERSLARLDGELRRGLRLARVVGLSLPGCRACFSRLEARLEDGRRRLDGATRRRPA